MRDKRAKATLLVVAFAVAFIKFNRKEFVMAMEMMPIWMETLEEEDISFIKNFVLCSGSLKQIAKEYGVTYPTVRLRLDRIIDKIRSQDDKESRPYVKLIKKLALDDKIDFETAKMLIHAYDKECERGRAGDNNGNNE